MSNIGLVIAGSEILLGLVCIVTCIPRYEDFGNLRKWLGIVFLSLFVINVIISIITFAFYLIIKGVGNA